MTTVWPQKNTPHSFIMCSHLGYAGRFIHSSHSMGYAVKSNLCCCLCIHTTISFCHANNFSVKSVLKQIRLEPLFNERLWFCHHLLYACISTVQNKTKQKHICNNFGFVQCFINLCVYVKVYLKSEIHFWFLRGFKALKWTRKWANKTLILPAHLMAIWTVAHLIFLFITWLCSRAKLCFFHLFLSLFAVSSEFADSGELFSKSCCHHSPSWSLSSCCLSLFIHSIQRLWILCVSFNLLCVCYFSLCVFPITHNPDILCCSSTYVLTTTCTDACIFVNT